MTSWNGNRRGFTAAFATIWMTILAPSRATAADLQEGNPPMSEDTTMRDLFDRWERVWHEGQYELVPSCVTKLHSA